MTDPQYNHAQGAIYAMSARKAFFVAAPAAWRRSRKVGGRSSRCCARTPPCAALHDKHHRSRRHEPDNGHVHGRDYIRDFERPALPRRVPRRNTYRASNWPWARARAQHSARLVRWLRMSLQGVAGSTVFAAVTEIGTRVLDVFSEALERSLYPNVETELVVDYGITKPSPEDRTYVDPLREWELSRVTYYHDSFGRRVYPQLQTEGTRARVGAVEYRDLAEEDEDSLADLQLPEKRRADTPKFVDSPHMKAVRPTRIACENPAPQDIPGPPR
jgi:hypothetical protein